MPLILPLQKFKYLFILLLVLSFSAAISQVPVISTFAPISGAIGSSVVIKGVNFSTNARDNIVYFGPTKATVISATAIQLTVTVPAGANCSPISVSTNGLISYAKLPFIVTFAGDAPLVSTSFEKEVAFNVPGMPGATKIKDIDGDGKPDLITANSNDGSMYVYRNINTIPGLLTAESFAGKITLTTAGYPGDFYTQDMDGDGRPDIVAAGNYGEVVHVFRNTASVGNITFESDQTFPAGSRILSVKVADFNGDGKPDVIVTNADDNTFTVLMNTSKVNAISFAPKISFKTGFTPTNVIAADFDGDGKTDIALSNSVSLYGDRVISIYPNTNTGGDVSFAQKIDIPIEDIATMAWGDIDGDGRADIVFHEQFGLAVLQNQSVPGKIAFAPRLDLSEMYGVQALSLVDINGDGKLDIIQSSAARCNITKNNSTAGNFSFAPPVLYYTKASTDFGDIDGDGKTDAVGSDPALPYMYITRNKINEPAVAAISPEIGIAGTPIKIIGQNFLNAQLVKFGDVNAVSFVINSTTSITAILGSGATGKVSVKNQYGTGIGPNFEYRPPAPAITSFAPKTGPIGANVTITGKNFSTTAANNIVFFGVARATVVSATTTQLVVKVPLGANYQPVTVSTNGLTATSAKPYDVTFAGAGPFAANSFNQRLDIPITEDVEDVLAADFDGDGKTDMVSRSPSVLSFYRNTSAVGKPSFTDKKEITPVGLANKIAISDINADGKPDLIYASTEGFKIVVLKNTSTVGTISFATPFEITDRSRPNGIAFADYDNDGRIDIAVTHSVKNTFAVYRNTVANNVLSFDTAVVIKSLQMNAYPLEGIYAGDIDGDGKIDVVTTNLYSSLHMTSTFKNISTLGKIAFTAVDYNNTAYHPQSILIEDIDGDDKPELIVPAGERSFQIYPNNTMPDGAFTFGSPVIGYFDYYPSTISIGDMDGDGKPDLIAPHAYFPGLINIFKNTSNPGSVSLGERVEYVKGGFNQNSTGLRFDGSAVADFDGDGKLDMVVTTGFGKSISIHINSINAPVIASFEPASATKGKTINITGTNFTDGSAVSFGGVSATSFTVKSPTSITAVVGDGATGEISVTTPIGVGKKAGFTFLPAPKFISFAPLAAAPGVTITLKGTNFTGTTAVTFGGINARSFSVIDDTSITAVVDNTAASGDVSVTVPGGTASLPGFVFSPVPIISGIMPVKGNIGSAVTITGTNFSADKSKNYVYFGAVKAQVTNATATELVVKVPAGTTYQPLSVTNTISGLTGASTVQFITTFDTKNSITAADFDPNVNFAAAKGAKTSAIGDIDGDGKPDVIIINTSANSISVFRNTGVSGSITSASFAANVDIATGNGPQAISIADINGDGKPDMALINLISNTISVYLNKSDPGNILFATKTDIVTGNAPYGIAAGDIDGDGRIDLVVANSADNSISVFKNTGKTSEVSFANKIDFATGSVPHGVVIMDMDLDGKSDILTVNSKSNNFSLLRNTSTPGTINAGSFEAHVEADGLNSPEAIDIGDINQDGRPDVIISNAGNGQVSVFGNLGILIYSNKTNLTADAALSSVALGDLDGDGRPDIVAANTIGKTFSIFRNTMPLGGVPVTSFAAKVTLPAAGSPSHINMADFDGDGKPDILWVDATSNTFGILRNNPGPATPAVQPPVVSSYSPGVGPAGATITVTGKNFSTAAENNIVFMGATKAKVSAASATQLSATVPAGTTYQPISVLNATNGLSGASSLPFSANFNSKNTISEADFSKPVNFLTIGASYAVAIADIDDDGKPDLVVTNPSSYSVSVFRNISITGSITNSSFADKIEYQIGGSPQSVVIKDMDGDGKPDLIVSTSNYTGTGNIHIISILRNVTKTGEINQSSFAQKVDIGIEGATKNLAVADMDGDGRPDIIAGNLIIVLNKSTKGAITVDSFTERAQYRAEDNIESMSVTDINNDDKPDIIYGTNNYVGIILNNSLISNLSLAPAIKLNESRGGAGMVVADIDGDKKLDIITTIQNLGGEYTSIFLMHNISSGSKIDENSFEVHVDFKAKGPMYNAAESSMFLTVTDVDGDSKPDLLYITSGFAAVSVYRNISTANTTAKTYFDNNFDLMAGAMVSGVAAADLDGDGKPEIVTVNFGDKTISVIPNKPTPAIVYTPPVITSVTPVAAKVGSTVTIKGINFNTSATDNIVFFGATKAVVNSATANSLLVTVPVSATYEGPSVLNKTNGLTGYARDKFSAMSPSKSMLTDKDFDALVDVFGFTAIYVRFADLDGDGKPDLIFHDGNEAIQVARNVSVAGTITPTSFGDEGGPSRYRYTVGSKPQCIKVTDIDGDGKPDILVTYYSFYGIGISVLLNQSTPGNLAFAKKVDINYNSVPFGPTNYFINTGDVDGDGKPEILIANSSLKGVSVLPNASSPGRVSFQSRYDFEAGQLPSSTYLYDIDGDGKPDLIVSNKQDNNISVLRNITQQGTINAASFVKQVTYGTVNAPEDIAIGDVNADGKPDIVVCSLISPTASVLQNNSVLGTINAASLASKVDVGTLLSGKHVELADMNGDGNPDIVIPGAIVINNLSSGVITPQFFSAKPVALVTTKYIVDLAVGDADGDGKTDIIASNNNSVYIFRNNAASATQPAITSFTPIYAVSGDTVTITGKNFNNVTSVAFGGSVAASYSVTSATTINAVVGEGATGNVTVVTPEGVAAKTGFTFMPKVSINALGQTTFNTPGFIVLQANEFVPYYTYQWQRDGINLQGETSFTYTATQSGSYTLVVIGNGITLKTDPVVVRAIYTLPADNFKIAIQSTTCKGSANGAITITALQKLNYIATVTGNGFTNTFKFNNALLAVNNLAAGSYNICFMVDGQADYKQCFTVVVTEPKDLSMYAVVKNTNQVVLALAGSETYHIRVNGEEQVTTDNQITLTLRNGLNRITLSTDKPCQGVVIKDLVIADRNVPFPNPFVDVVYISLGDKIIKEARIRLYDIFYKIIYDHTFTNQSGVVQLDVSAVHSGVFFLQKVADGEAQTFKLIKK